MELAQIESMKGSSIMEPFRTPHYTTRGKFRDSTNYDLINHDFTRNLKVPKSSNLEPRLYLPSCGVLKIHLVLREAILLLKSGWIDPNHACYQTLTHLRTRFEGSIASRKTV